METGIEGYHYTEYVIRYEFNGSSGENTERCKEFESAVDRVRELYKKGCLNIRFRKETMTNYDITTIIQSI